MEKKLQIFIKNGHRYCFSPVSRSKQTLKIEILEVQKIYHSIVKCLYFLLSNEAAFLSIS